MEIKEQIKKDLESIDLNYKGEIDITKREDYSVTAKSFYLGVMKEVLAKAIQEQAIKTATLVETQDDLQFNRGVIHGLTMVDGWFRENLNYLLEGETLSGEIDLYKN